LIIFKNTVSDYSNLLSTKAYIHADNLLFIFSRSFAKTKRFVTGKTEIARFLQCVI